MKHLLLFSEFFCFVYCLAVVLRHLASRVLPITYPEAKGFIYALAIVALGWLVFLGAGR